MLIPCFDSPAVIPYMTLERRPALARLVDRVDRGTASPVLKDDDVSQRTNVLDVLVSALNQLDNESKKTGGISEAEIDAIFAAMLFGSNFEDPIDIASRMIDGGTPEVVDRINTKMARDHGVLSGIARRKDAKERWEDAALELANTLDRNLTQTATTVPGFPRKPSARSATTRSGSRRVRPT
jgi:hypothetical protein